MENKGMGTLNHKETNTNKSKNKQIIVLLVAIVAVIVVVSVVLKTMNKAVEKTKADVSSIVSNAETKIIYVGNSDSKKCKNCSKIQNYLDEQGINYLTYDVSAHSEKEYKEMLRTIEINPDDFGYPAVIYIKEGRLYSNVINLEDTKPVESFIKNYELKKIK